jgi:hypothetical protein
MRYNRQHLLVLLWLTSIVTVSACYSGSVLAGTAIPSQVGEILHWLPLDTETIVVASGPFKLEKAPGHQSFHLQKAMESLPIGILQELMPRELTGRTVSLAVEGSRCFRSPRGLGMMPFQGCQVVVFEEDTASALTAAMRSLLDSARRTIEFSGQRVAVFEKRWEENTWTLYVAQPRPGILLCATHEGYLKEMLTRMAGKPSTRAMAQDIPEWKHVSTKARVWAVRHYSKAGAAQDPSSPLRDEAAANVPDLGAVGMTFSYDADGKLATVRYLTRAKDAVAITRKGWYLPGEKLTPKIEEVEAGVVQITITVGNDEVGGIFLFVLLARLGHAVYV